MSKPNFTAWYPGATTPERKGLYQRKSGRGVILWAWWDGKKWLAANESKKEVLRMRFNDLPSAFQTQWEWRGIYYSAG